jgi:hypothetical protein
VNLARARLRCGLQQCARGGPELGVVVVGRDFEILQRVQIRIDRSNVENRAVIFRAIEQGPIGGKNCPLTLTLIPCCGFSLMPCCQELSWARGSTRMSLGHITVEHR